MRDPDYAIVGAGAIGSVLAAHLARAGHEVAVLARGARAAQVERDGLVIEGLAAFPVPVRVVSDPAALRAARVLIVATKTPGTAETLASLGHVALEAALSIQNGPGKNDLLAAAFGPDRTLGALANTSAELQAGGAVLFTRNVNVFIGELPEGTSPRVQRIVRELDASGVRATETSQVLALEWSKFCAWAGLMALSVTTRRPTWAFLVDPDAALVIVRVVREMVRLAAALGIEVSDESVLPVASIARGTDRDAVAAVAAVGERYRRDAPGHRMSSLQDVDAGRPLEVHETLGYALERAAALGLELPVLRTLHGLTVALDPARHAPGP
ncbi:MAG: ketopantoate reductase family protein [Steroidobacteraceae bacterium]|nr:ketopantoate reductase family protein [Steroidobacteraceae bacterium]